MSTDYEVNKVARRIVKDTLADIRAYAQDKSGEDQEDCHVTVLAGLVAALVAETLSQSLPHSLPPEDKGKVAMQRFAMMKEKLTTAVGMGFTAAMESSTGKELEYFCILKPVPECKNKLPA